MTDTMKRKKPELMSPVKNRAGFLACKDYSDAVYFGVSKLNLRTNSPGITLENLKGFMNDCHKEDIKGYLTVNSVLYNSDLSIAEEIIYKAKEAGVDAVIVWDPAAIKIAKKEGIDFFISTQASVSNWSAAEFYEKAGAKRIIASREMTLSQIEKMKKKTNLEIESFIHGAVCLAISGRCIISNYYEQRSANKGACNQFCRRKWSMEDDRGNVMETDGKYYMSAKDICMIEYIPEMIEAGIDSFKIEGRQRSSKYIKETAKYYRLAIDSYFEGSFSRKKAKKWKEELKKVYNRNFTTGFYFGSPGKEGINFDFYGNAGTLKRLQVGEVEHYYPKKKVALVNLKHSNLEPGDAILIEGKNTYLEDEVTTIEVDKKRVEKGEKGTVVGLKIKERVRKNDKLFRLSE